jgi:hypothetical protein
MQTSKIKQLSIAACTACAVFISASAAHAQKMIDLKLDVEELNENAKSCNLTQSTVKAISSLTLRNNGIRAIDNSSDILAMNVIVTVLLTPDKSYCMANVQAEMSDFVPGPNLVKRGNFSSKGINALVQLCGSSAVVASTPGQFSKYVSDSVEQQIKLCLGQLEY